MAYEYLTARVTLQKKKIHSGNQYFFFLNGNLGKAFSLTKNTMNYPELNLLSTLAGRGKKRLQFLTVLRVCEREFLCKCARRRICICDLQVRLFFVFAALLTGASVRVV